MNTIINRLHIRRWLGLPLGVQMIALLVCALLAAQLVTLALTVVLPPAPPQRWGLDDVARGLSGGQLSSRLERQRMAGPPDISMPGWLVSPTSQAELAQQLGQPRGEVVLAFFTDLPVGGISAPVHPRSTPVASAQPGLLGLISSAHAQAGPAGAAAASPGGGGFPVGGFPGGGFPGGGFPGGGFPGARLPGGRIPGGRIPGGRIPGGHLPGGQIPGGHAPGVGTMPTPHISLPQAAPPPGLAAPLTTTGPLSNPAMAPLPIIVPQISAGRVPLPAVQRPVAHAAREPQAQPTTSAPLAGTTPATSTQVPAIAQPQAGDGASAAPQALPSATPQPIPFRRSGSQGLLALAPQPFITGDFIAAARQPDGSWVAVAPRAEPFPNRWQQRVMIWFVLSLAIVSPLAWLFARRIVDPLQGFAEAAEALGRDPSATIMPLSGPAEIGRAAYAFNQMRNRLRAFVDDRTAMVGAISHDLRTPLTRLRFRIEDVPDELRGGLLKEVTEMEAMISQVITFIRDASTPGKRETVDLRELVAGSVKDAELVGGRIAFEGSGCVPVEVDPVGMRRLLGNLLENAVKYGDHAKVKVRVLNGEAVAEVIDNGPGIPEDELDHVFEPFYRTEAARKSGKPGSGLGLAVCRSIARAHGGDVALAHEAEGFVARVSMPLVFEDRAGFALHTKRAA